jgi:hypothetical protein
MSIPSTMATMTYRIKAIIVASNAPRKPIWCRAAMISHAIINTIIHANHP